MGSSDIMKHYNWKLNGLSTPSPPRIDTGDEKGSCLLSGLLRGNRTQWEEVTSSKTTMQCFQNLILCPVTIKYSICRSKLPGFPGGSDSKESACGAGDLGSIPGLGRFPGEGHGNPLQCSCLKNPMDRGAWSHGVKKNQTSRRQLSTSSGSRTWLLTGWASQTMASLASWGALGAYLKEFMQSS